MRWSGTEPAISPSYACTCRDNETSGCRMGHLEQFWLMDSVKLEGQCSAGHGGQGEREWAPAK